LADEGYFSKTIARVLVNRINVEPNKTELDLAAEQVWGTKTQQIFETVEELDEHLKKLAD